MACQRRVGTLEESGYVRLLHTFDLNMSMNFSFNTKQIPKDNTTHPKQKQPSIKVINNRIVIDAGASFHDCTAVVTVE